MPTLKGKKQVNLHIDDEDYEDLVIVANRRGQSISEFIRRAIQRELSIEADAQIRE